MDLQALSLPDWLPWWGVVALLVPMALYLALFLLMPFSTFGLRGRLRELEMRLDGVHEEVRSLTLRLPDRGGPDMYGDLPAMDLPPIPPSAPALRDTPARATTPRDSGPRGGFGDPVADRMLAYMREKARSEAQRAEQPRAAAPRQRTEPRFIPTPPEPEPPPPPSIAGRPSGPPRVPSRFSRRPPDA